MTEARDHIQKREYQIAKLLLQRLLTGLVSLCEEGIPGGASR
jgi:hypothetical protein